MPTNLAGNAQCPGNNDDVSLSTSAKMFVRWRAVGGQGSLQITKREQLEC